MRWDPVTTPAGIRVDRYQVIVTQEAPERELALELRAPATSARVPPEFLEPGEEVLVARAGSEVAAHMAGLTLEKARAIGRAAHRRVLAEHTYAHRAAQVEALLTDRPAAVREVA